MLSVAWLHLQYDINMFQFRPIAPFSMYVVCLRACPGYLPTELESTTPNTPVLLQIRTKTTTLKLPIDKIIS